MRWTFILIVLGLGIAGCSRGVNMHPFNTAGLDADFEQPPTQTLPAVYCYQNLTMSPDCYDRPIAGEERRLMGYYGPEPAQRGYYGRRSF
jgi:hypothetical protein